MTPELIFDDARKLITMLATGSENMDSRLEALRALRADPRFRGDCRILCNFLDARFVPNTTERFALGLMVSAFFRGHKIALVVGPAEQAKLSDLVATISTGRVEINVFNGMNAAESWLMSAPGPEGAGTGG